MSASSAAAKGKARAIDPLPSEPHKANGQQADQRFIKPQPIPSISLLAIEYPGTLKNDSKLERPSSSSSFGATCSSLERALSTLHPSALPPLTSSPHEALNFLSRIPNEGISVVESRLGGFATLASSSSGQGQGQGQGVETSNLDDVYRAPLIGEAVPTHNIVLRIVKRTWRQKKRKRPSSPSSPQPNVNVGVADDSMALDPALLAESDPNHTVEQANGYDDDNVTQEQRKRGRYTGRIKKEYRVEVLGMATNTVRFRSMADFAFQPKISTTPPSPSSSHPEEGIQLDPVMSLHKALATMDLSAFQNFRIPRQLEDYHLPNPSGGGGAVSNLDMVPPAFFSRMEVPFNYNFQQFPYSELRTIPTPSHLAPPPQSSSAAGPSGYFPLALRRNDLQPGQMQRFVNRVRLSNIAPQPFRVGRDTRVPTHPLTDVVRIEHRCDPKLLTKLKQLLEERPIWSRVALKNQLEEEEWKEVSGNNEKVYYALVGYSMVGGPWRDTVVRFGYDVREDVGSRIYQRLFLRGGPSNRESRLGLLGSSRPAEVEEAVGGEEEEEPEETPQTAARSSVVPLPSSTTAAAKERARNTHIFTGTSLHRNVGNFQLCDIHDPLIQSYILHHSENYPSPAVEAMGVPWLRQTYDPETGWYTRRALELIRALVTARFKALAERGAELEEWKVEGIVERFRVRWGEEDATAMAVEDHVREGEEEGRGSMEVDNTAPMEGGQAGVNGDGSIDPSLM